MTRQLVDVPACTTVEYAEPQHDFRRPWRQSLPTASERAHWPFCSSAPATTPASSPTARLCRPRRQGPSTSVHESVPDRATGEESDPTRAAESYRAILADQPGLAEAILGWRGCWSVRETGVRPNRTPARPEISTAC